MSLNLQLEGKRALVTGGTKGVGAAVVTALLRAGVEVITTARKVPDTSPDKLTYMPCDLTTSEGCEVLTNKVLKQFGSVDIIVNVLGGSNSPGGGFSVLDDSKWFAEINLNLMPAVRIDRALLPSMI